MPTLNPIVAGRKNCSRCSRWLHITEFSCQRREPFKLQSQCKACAREVVREWYRENPEKRAEYTKRWRERNLEEERRRGREEQAARRADPRTAEIVREQTRQAWRRMRDDPERWAAHLAQQRRNYARRNEDPQWRAEQQAKRHAHYENGGREEAAAKRAREKIRRRFAQILVNALRAELERREAVAKAARAKRSRWLREWIADRRERFEAGEFDNLPPVFGNGSDGPELQRLPSAPLAKWIRGHWSVEDLAIVVEMHPRAISRYATGESVTVGLDVVDAITTRTGTLLLDIYPPDRYPEIYDPEYVPPRRKHRAKPRPELAEAV